MVMYYLARYAEPGNDAHGLAQRIAYGIWQERQKYNRAGSEALDWAGAEMEIYSATRDWPHIFGEGPDRFHEQLKWKSSYIGATNPGNSQDENWYLALDFFADLVLSRMRVRGTPCIRVHVDCGSDY